MLLFADMRRMVPSRSEGSVLIKGVLQGRGQGESVWGEESKTGADQPSSSVAGRGCAEKQTAMLASVCCSIWLTCGGRWRRAGDLAGCSRVRCEQGSLGGRSGRRSAWQGSPQAGRQAGKQAPAPRWASQSAAACSPALRCLLSCKRTVGEWSALRGGGGGGPSGALGCRKQQTPAHLCRQKQALAS